MQITAELRWFWDHEPDPLRIWFHDAERHGCLAFNNGSRIDRYLLDRNQPELGIKERGGPEALVEIKGLIGVEARELTVGNLEGYVELWAKWPSQGLKLENQRMIAVHKERWLRSFDTTSGALRELAIADRNKAFGSTQSLPTRGCNVEFTKLLVNQQVWWTFGIEAFGALETVGSDLRFVALELTSRGVPDFVAGFAASYPVWLSAHYQAGTC